MKIQIHWLCFIILARSFEIEAEKSLFSCTNYLDNFCLTINCASLDDNILHRNHLNEIKDETCTTRSTWESVSNNVLSANEITLKNCRLPILPHNFLQHLEHIKKIYLDISGIKAIDNGTFPDGWRLEELSMSKNDLTKLPGFTFSRMPNISEINFSENRINNIDPFTFQGTTKMMRVIDLSHNNIGTIDKVLFNDLINLNTLNLGHNFIEHFLVDLSKLKDLTILELDNNKIAQLDCAIFDLTTNKIIINVNHNHIREINLNCDVNLESIELYFDDNQLTSLTFPKSNLVNGLTTMHASRNYIDKITFPQSFQQLTDLQLNINNLKELVEWEETMFPKLRSLGISGNQFNCSYLTIFLKSIPKTMTLGTEIDQSKTTKKVHGISCNDGSDYIYNGDVAHAHTIIWCLFAFLSFAVAMMLSVKFVKSIKKHRGNEPFTFFHKSSDE